MENSQVTLHIYCYNLPGSRFEARTNLRLGIQKGSVVIDDVTGDTQSVVFTVFLNVSTNRATGNPNFTGPFTHGIPNERFIYLCWGERDNAVWEGFRRAKLPLQTLTWEAVNNSIQSGTPIKVTVCMTDYKGGPLCASVKDDKMCWEL